MRKTGAILGTLLIAAVLIISGSAAATWVWVTLHSSNNCTSPGNIAGVPDGNEASLGNYGPPAVLGWIITELGSGNEMPNNQDFTVFAASSLNESYDIYVGETSNPAATQYVGTGWDTEDLTFQTPSTGKDAWRFIYLEGKTGTLTGDPAPGPEIDAVGWDKP